MPTDVGGHVLQFLVAHVFAYHEVNDVFGDVSGVVTSLQRAQRPNDIQGASSGVKSIYNGIYLISQAAVNYTMADTKKQD